jgi:hypothetical protein
MARRATFQCGKSFVLLFGLTAAGAAAAQPAPMQRALPFGPWPSRADQPLRRVAYLTTLAGVHSDSSVWEGQLEGDLRGPLRIALRQVESPVEAANPVWHVRGRLTTGRAGAPQSCTAVLEGVVDWKSGMLRLSGVVTGGALRGAQLATEGWLVNGDLSGVLWIAGRPADR